MGNRKKRAKGSVQSSNYSPVDDDLENASIISVASEGGQSSIHFGSDSASVTDDAPSAAEPNAAIEDSFSDALEGLTVSSSNVREKSLNIMKKLLQMKHLALVNIISKNYETLSYSLTSCVKRGKNTECSVAAHCLSLLCMQLVNLADCDVEHFYLENVKPILRQILTDESFKAEDRSAIAASLGLACYSCSDDPKEIESVMNLLQIVFVGSCLKGDGTVRQVGSTKAAFHRSALLSWAILFSRDRVYISDGTLVKIAELLQSPELDLRISAGETLALVYEMRRESVETYRLMNHRDLCDRLRSMAHDGQKSKAKKDLRIQRSSFREIAHFIDGSETEINTETVKIGRNDLLELSSWADRLMYYVLCGVFGSGLKHQLQENSYIRERVFGLEPWVPEANISLKDERLMKNELKRCRRMEDQARTLARQKGRAKRVASFSAQ